MKTLDVYNFVLCGHVQDIEYRDLSDGFCALRTEVLPSQRQGHKTVTLTNVQDLGDSEQDDQLYTDSELHLYGWVMKPSEKTCLFLDPLGESATKMKHCQVMTRAFMRWRGLNIRKWPCTTLPHPLQQDTTSCGVFALNVCTYIFC